MQPITLYCTRRPAITGGQPGIRSRVDRLLTQVLQEFNVDTNRVYIAGFSNGGTGALDYARTEATAFCRCGVSDGRRIMQSTGCAGLEKSQLTSDLARPWRTRSSNSRSVLDDTFDGLKRLEPKRRTRSSYP